MTQIPPALFPHSPQTSEPKEKGKMLFLFVCTRVIGARGPLFASSGAAALIADNPASTEPPSPARFPAAVAPEAGYNQLRGPYRWPHCLCQQTFS